MLEPLTIAGASARAAAFSALRGGFEPHAADLFADADLAARCAAQKVSHYPEGLLAACAGPQAGGWMYTGALENYPELVDRIGAVRPLFGNPGAVLRRVRDPLLVASTFARRGLAAPEVRLLPDGLPRDGSWLRKPLRSSGGRDIGPLTSELAEAPERAWYYQRLAHGESCAAVYVAAGGEAKLLGVTRQLIGVAWTGASRFAYCGSLGLIELAPSLRARFAAIGTCLAEEFDLRGLFGVDVIVRGSEAGDSETGGSEVWPLEVNPRYTSSVELVERHTSESAVALHVRACRGGTLGEVARPSTIPRSSDALRAACWGKAVLFADRALDVQSETVHKLIKASAAHEEMADSSTNWPRLADIPSPGTHVRRGAALLTIFAHGENERTTLATLEAQAALVRRLVQVR